MNDTTQKLTFSNTEDIQNYLNSINPAVQNANAPAAKKDTPTEHTQTEKDFLDKADAIVRRQVEKKTDFITLPPLQKKPAFYLEHLTPFLKVDMVFLYVNPRNINAKYEEKRVTLFGENMNNELKSFKYSVMSGETGGGSAPIEITFIDPKQEITEYLAMQLASAGVVLSGKDNPVKTRLDIEYGWSYNPDYFPEHIKDWDAIVFTNHVIGIFTTLETKFANNGIPETVIKAEAENTGHLVFSGAKPFDVFGPFPAISICFEEVKRLFDEVFHKIANENNITNDNVNAPILQMGYYLFTRGVLDKKLIGDIIKTACDYYSHVSYSSTKDTTDKSTQTNQSANIIQAAAYILNGNKIKDVINGANFTKNPGYITITKNTMLEVVNPANTAASNEAIQKVKTNPIKLYHIDQRAQLDSELASDPTKKYFTNFFIKLGTAIHNCFKIHPYYMYKYVTNVIQTQINSNASYVDHTYIEMWDYQVNLEKYLLPDNFLAPNYVHMISNGAPPANETYYLDANNGSLHLNLASSWEDFLMAIFNNMYLKYTPPNKNNLQQGLQTQITDVDTKNLKTQGFIPIPIKSTVYCLNGKGARQNIEAWLKMLELRKEFLTNVPHASSGTNDVASVDELILKTKAYKDTINPGEQSMYIIQFLTLKSSVGNALGTGIGAQKIAQAYSVRCGNTASNGTMYNPGEPTCMDVCFDDVISAEFDYQFEQAIQSVARGVLISGETPRGDLNIISISRAKRAELLKQANDLVAKGDARNNPTTVKELTAIVSQLNEVDPSAALSQSSLAKKSSFPINVSFSDYNQSRVYSGDYYNMLERKRNLQNIRSQLMLSQVIVNCNLTIAGDATFGFANHLDYVVFLKITNVDGTLSIFSGLYRLMNISHEVTGGDFKTIFKLQSDQSSDNNISETYAAQLNKMIYSSDKQKPLING